MAPPRARVYQPALSRGAFKNLRPTGNYQNYLNFLGRHRPGWDPTRANVVQRVRPSLPISAQPTYQNLLSLVGQGFDSPAQMEARANRMTQQNLAAQQALINQTYKQSQDDAMRRMLAFQAAGRSAAAMNAQLIGIAGQGYASGAGEMQNLSGSLGAAMAGATAGDVAAADARIANAGVAPALTEGGPVGSPGIAGPAQAAVETYYGGTLPAQAMGTAGEAARYGIAGEISSQNLRATQEAQAAYMAAMRDAGTQRASAVQALAQGRPDVASKYLLQLQDAQRQQIALASSLIGQAGQAKQQAFGRKVTRTQLGMQQQQQERAWNQQLWDRKFRTKQLNQQQQQYYAGLKTKLAQYKIQMSQVDPSVSRVLGYVANSQGIAVTGKDGKPIPVKSYTRGGGGGMTAGQYSRLMEKAPNLVEGMYYGYGYDPVTKRRIPVNQMSNFDPNTSKFGQGTVDYGPALQRLTKMGMSPQDARDMLNQYWTVPGQHGRPVWDSTAQQNAIKKHYGPKHYKWFMDNITRALQQGDTAQALRWRNLAISGRNPGWVTPVQ